MGDSLLSKILGRYFLLKCGKVTLVVRSQLRSKSSKSVLLKLSGEGPVFLKKIFYWVQTALKLL